MDRLPPPLIARFAADLARVWNSEGRLGIAVSGGADSIALLLLANEALPGHVAAATVDHGLRRESADEAAAVATLCRKLGVPHVTLAVTVGAGNLQAQARQERYRALGVWAQSEGLTAVATAHHADDQAETLLMRLQRGSGVSGLAGVRPTTVMAESGLLVIRPLLGWRREWLAEIVAGAGVDASVDPSNHDPRFERASIRAHLAGAAWLDPRALANSAAHLADADEALDWAAAREWEEAVRTDGERLIYCPAAPKAVVLRVLARIIGEIDARTPRGSALAQFYQDLALGRPASLGDVAARPTSRGWIFRRARKRGSA